MAIILGQKSAKIRILHFLAYLALFSYLNFDNLCEMKIPCAYNVKKTQSSNFGVFFTHDYGHTPGKISRKKNAHVRTIIALLILKQISLFDTAVMTNT